MRDELYTAPAAAELATTWRRIVSAGAAAVTPGTIRSWAHRGHLEATGLDENGHPLYAHTDIARAERITRDRALRLVGIGFPSHPLPEPCGAVRNAVQDSDRAAGPHKQAQSRHSANTPPTQLT